MPTLTSTFMPFILMVRVIVKIVRIIKFDEVTVLAFQIFVKVLIVDHRFGI